MAARAEEEHPTIGQPQLHCDRKGGELDGGHLLDELAWVVKVVLKFLHSTRRVEYGRDHELAVNLVDERDTVLGRCGSSKSIRASRALRAAWNCVTGHVAALATRLGCARFVAARLTHLISLRCWRADPVRAGTILFAKPQHFVSFLLRHVAERSQRALVQWEDQSQIAVRSRWQS